MHGILTIELDLYIIHISLKKNQQFESALVHSVLSIILLKTKQRNSGRKSGLYYLLYPFILILNLTYTI